MAEKKTTAQKAKNPESSKEKKDVQSREPDTDPQKEKDVGKNLETGKAKEEQESYLKDLMAISGHGGLFRFVSQGRNGIIVESIETGKRMQAFATMKVSSLEDIAVYTEDEEAQLETVFAAIHKYENGAEAISPKSDPDDLKDYFSAVIPEYDRDRVYISDIKKILGWYNLLLKHDLIETGKTGKKSPAKSTDASAKTTDTARDKEGQAAKAGPKEKKPAVPKSTVKHGSDSHGKGMASKPGARKTPTAK